MACTWNTCGRVHLPINHFYHDIIKFGQKYKNLTFPPSPHPPQGEVCYKPENRLVFIDIDATYPLRTNIKTTSSVWKTVKTQDQRQKLTMIVDGIVKKSNYWRKQQYCLNKYFTRYLTANVNEYSIWANIENKNNLAPSPTSYHVTKM